MASRRMISKQLICTDSFLDLSAKAKILYLYFIVEADDDGFITNTKYMLKMLNSTQKTLKELQDAGYLILFSNGNGLIVHWNIYNQIRKDRYTETTCKAEKSLVYLNENNEYALKEMKNNSSNDNQLLETSPAQYSIGKVSIVKDSLEENKKRNLPVGETDAKDEIPYKEIIDYLNKKTEKNFSHKIQKTKDLIKARFNEGRTLEDFYKVIDVKCFEWLKTDMAKYLRPETLFSNKFESYLNQKIDGKDIYKIDKFIDWEEETNVEIWVCKSCCLYE